MKQKLLLFLSLFLLMGGGVHAAKWSATWGTIADKGNWDAETSTYSWTQGYSNLATIFETPGGILAQYTSLHLTTSDYVTEGMYRVCFMNGGATLATIVFYTAGQKDLTFSERSETQNIDLSKVTHISFGGASASGSIKVENIYLEKPDELSATPIPASTSLNALPYKSLKDNSNLTPTWGVGTTSDPIYGTFEGEVINAGSITGKYCDITDYEELRIYKETNEKLRLFFIPKDIPDIDNPSKDKNTSVTTIYTDDATYSRWDSEEKCFVINIASLPKYNGRVLLQAIKTNPSWNGGTYTTPVTDIVVIKKPVAGKRYYISGGGAIGETLKNVLADKELIYLDATGITTTTPITLTTANPNCIILAKEGALTNDINVAIDGRVERLVLKDGYSFQAPENMTAGKAQYTRESNAKYGTIVLPFNGTSADVKFYEIKSMTKEAIVLEEVTELTAGTPAIIEKTTDKSEILITGEEGKITNVTEVSKADGAVMMHGSYTQGTTVTDANSYYIKGDKFYSINDNFVCNAFRGYFTTVNSTAAARLAIITDNNVTGVNSVEIQEDANTIVEVYNAAGVQQKGMQKGVNIARLANGKTVTVIVK